MATMTENGKMLQSPVVDEELIKQIMRMMPQQKVEKTEPRNVLTKMMIEGRADKLLNILSTILNTYIKKDSYGNILNTSKNLVMTFMLEDKPLPPTKKS